MHATAVVCFIVSFECLSDFYGRKVVKRKGKIPKSLGSKKFNLTDN